MSNLHPNMFPTSVSICTASGWIRGVLHVPVVKGLQSFLNGNEEVLKLTDVTLPGSWHPHPFMVFNKRAVWMLVPTKPSEVVRSEAPAVPRERRLVTCLLGQGSLCGRLELPESLRTSDYLLRSPGFIELFSCHLGPSPYDNPRDTFGEALPLVLINARELIGITEEIPVGITNEGLTLPGRGAE